MFLIEFIGSLLSSDYSAFVMFAAAAMMYIIFVKPMILRNRELETDLKSRLDTLATKEEIKIIVLENNLSETNSEDLNEIMGELNETKGTLQKILEHSEAIKEKATLHNSKLSSITGNLSKIIHTLNGLYNMVEALIEELEKKELIAKIDRRVINNVRSSLYFTKNEMENVKSVLRELLNQNLIEPDRSDRLDRLFDQED
jgi:methyl-accepting chemotaxis protein